jgi:glycosyltransferase involved in cell wall biosynthesis
MGMLARTGGSSIVAQEVGEGVAALGFAVRYCHLDINNVRPELDLHFDAAPGNASSALLDVQPALGGGLDAASGLLRAYQRWPFDLLHLHNLQVFGPPALMLKWMRSVPYVVTCHGSDVLSETLMDRNRDVGEALLRQAAAVTCVSQHLADALQRKIPGLRHVLVIPNFVRAAWRQPHATRQPEPARFLHVSSLRSVKRPELLLEAFRRVRVARPDATLAIVTTAMGRERLRRLVGDQPHAQGLRVIDDADDPQVLAREYRRACALLITSRFEGFGLVVLEALTHGVPVVAPAVGALPEVLGHDWPLLVEDCDEQDAAVDAVAAAALRAVEGNGIAPKQIAAVLAKYDGPSQIAAYARLYRQVLASPLVAAP